MINTCRLHPFRVNTRTKQTGMDLVTDRRRITAMNVQEVIDVKNTIIGIEIEIKGVECAGLRLDQSDNRLHLDLTKLLEEGSTDVVHVEVAILQVKNAQNEVARCELVVEMLKLDKRKKELELRLAEATRSAGDAVISILFGDLDDNYVGESDPVDGDPPRGFLKVSFSAFSGPFGEGASY